MFLRCYFCNAYIRFFDSFHSNFKRMYMERNNAGLFLIYALFLEKSDERIIQTGKPLYFSSSENAIETIRTFSTHYPYLYNDSTSDQQIYCLIMEQYALDTTYRYQLSTWVFSKDGALLCDSLVPDDGPFWGRQKSAICHQLGDLVEAPLGNKLYYGIVIEQPISFNENVGDYGLTASDDCYAVMRYPDKEIFYAHAPFVFKPTGKVDIKIRDFLVSG
jgi:hypothetical protein